jgi:hypothetical protein
MSDLVDILKFLSDKVFDWENLEHKKIQDLYEIVETSFKDLESIHHDYSTKLSLLRQHLLDKSMPPKDLIKWLRETA